jgi:hypothetical protein
MTEWERAVRNGIAQIRAEDPEGVINPQRAELADGAEQFLSDYQDIAGDDEMVRQMLARDNYLAADPEYSHLAIWPRLRVAANHVRSGSTEPLDVDASQALAIQNMARGRASVRAAGWTRQAEWEGFRARMRDGQGRENGDQG